MQSSASVQHSGPAHRPSAGQESTHEQSSRCACGGGGAPRLAKSHTLFPSLSTSVAAPSGHRGGFAVLDLAPWCFCFMPGSLLEGQLWEAGIMPACLLTPRHPAQWLKHTRGLRNTAEGMTAVCEGRNKQVNMDREVSGLQSRQWEQHEQMRETGKERAAWRSGSHPRRPALRPSTGCLATTFQESLCTGRSVKPLHPTKPKRTFYFAELSHITVDDAGFLTEVGAGNQRSRSRTRGRSHLLAVPPGEHDPWLSRSGGEQGHCWWWRFYLISF